MSNRTQNLKELIAKLQLELEKHPAEESATILCPSCNQPIQLLTQSSSRPQRRKRGFGKRPARRAGGNGKVKAAGRRRGRRNKPSELVSLALRYAKEKRGGRIGDAYRDVKNGIAKQSRGKNADEIRQMKTAWFRKQLSK